VKKIILTTTLFCSFIIAEDIKYGGVISTELSYISHDLDKTRDKQIALRLDVNSTYKIDKDKRVVIRLKSLTDAGDEDRRYFDIANLYFEHDFEKSRFLIGRNIRDWSAMEFYSHTDNFNTKNWLDNPFDFDSKLGAWNFEYLYHLEDADISLIAKMYEDSQRVQDSRSSNRLLPKNYDSALETSRDRSSPTLYLKYSPSKDKDFNYSLIFQRGYDEQRYLAPVNIRDINSSVRQNAYVVDKLMGYATLTQENTKYKTELAYTHSEDSKVSNYAQMSVGVEHTLNKLYKDMDLGVLFEIYEYKAFEENHLKAVDFGKLFDDDIVLGFKLSQNDKYGSELLSGVTYDRHNEDKIYFMKYGTYISDKYKLGVNLQHLAPHKSSVFKDADSVKVEVGYLF
jgi:hypothetical protein